MSLRHWLRAQGSLTQQLIAICSRDFRVERIAQRWQRPTLSEARLLRIDPLRHALVREVILWGDGRPWIYARSVLPISALRGDLRRLRYLRNASLGALLFRFPHLQRSEFQIARVDPGALPTPLQARHPLWARRSRFAVGNRTLIVGEIFLEPFCKLLKQQPALQTHRMLKPLPR